MNHLYLLQQKVIFVNCKQPT